MKKNTFYPIVVNGTLFLGLIAGSCISQTKDAKQKTKKPNIVYIVADDLGYGDLSLFGQDKFETPNIDKLAERGMVFTQHYAGTTVSAPSRASLFTGKHTGHCYTRGNREIMPEGQEPLASTEFTITEMLKEGGYVTGAFGKWGLGYPASEGAPENQGVDRFYGYNCQRLGHSYYPYHLWDDEDKEVLVENADGENRAYAPSLIHQQALRFIEQNKDTTFFMYYPTIIPHAELAAPDSLIAKFRGKYGEEKAYKGVDKGNKGFRLSGYASQAEPHATFAAMVTLLDIQVGEIVKKLEDLGLMDNTLLVFTSDNGAHKEGGADPLFFDSNGPFRGYKRDLYEGGIRVPTIMVWDNKIEAGSTTNHISAFWDVMPTFADVAGQPIPKGIDGISFLPTLLGKKQPQHKFLYWEFHEGGGRQAVRMGDWKGVRLNMSDNPNAPIELYNLSTDISESNNVAEKFPEIVKQIDEIMKKEHIKSDIFPFKYEMGK